MKKVLFATTALVAIAAITSPANAAEKIKLGLGGYMEQQIGVVDNEDDAGVTNFSSFDIKSDAEIYISGSTTLDNGIKISARMDLEGNSGDGVDEAYLTIQSDWGTLKLGEDDGASDDFANNMQRGLSGDYDNWVVERNLNRGMGDDTYSAPDGDANKINYTTPSIAGFQAGISYTPESGVTGVDGDTPNYVADTGSVIAAGASYKGSVSDVGVKLTWAYAHAGLEGSTTESLVGHHVGLELSTAGFTGGVAYGRQFGNDLDATDDAHSLHASVSYKSGPMQLGFYHQADSTEQVLGGGEDEVTLNSVFFNYDLSDGVAWQSMIFNVDYDSGNAAIVDSTFNDGGWGVVGGLKVSF